MGNYIHPDEYAERLKIIIGPRIRVARKALGLSQVAVAKSIGITYEYLGRLERGHALPSTTILLKLANALEVAVDYLFGIEEHVPTPAPKPVRDPWQITYIVNRARNDPALIRLLIKLWKLCEHSDGDSDE